MRILFWKKFVLEVLINSYGSDGFYFGIFRIRVNRFVLLGVNYLNFTDEWGFLFFRVVERVGFRSFLGYWGSLVMRGRLEGLRNWRFGFCFLISYVVVVWFWIVYFILLSWVEFFYFLGSYEDWMKSVE